MRKTLIAAALALVSGSVLGAQCAPIVQITQTDEGDQAFVRTQFSSADSGGRNLIGVEIGGELVQTTCSPTRDLCCEQLGDREVLCDLPETAVGTVRFLALRNGFPLENDLNDSICRRGTYAEIE